MVAHRLCGVLTLFPQTVMHWSSIGKTIEKDYKLQNRTVTQAVLNVSYYFYYLWDSKDIKNDNFSLHTI